VRIGKIADQHGIPARFLVQILLQLKGAGFVTSTRGASGGYELTVSPDKVSLGDVMGVIEGQDDLPTSSASPDSQAAKVLQSAWMEVTKVERKLLQSFTFAELVKRSQQPSEGMYYI
jgi:Rrf2 family protein